MQITFLGLNGYLEIKIFVFSFFLLIFEMSVPIGIFLLANNSENEEKYDLLFELFNNDILANKGFLGIIYIRKFFFGLFIIFFNQFPLVN